MIKTCEQCGEEYEIENCKVKQRFCSRKCSNRYYGEAKTIPLFEKICEYCGDKYETKNRYRKYCGKSCSMTHFQSKKRSYVNNKKNLAKAVPVIKSEPTIPVWNTTINVNKELFKEFEFTGSVRGIIQQIIGMEFPENHEPIDIHIKNIGERT